MNFEERITLQGRKTVRAKQGVRQKAEEGFVTLKGMRYATQHIINE